MDLFFPSDFCFSPRRRALVCLAFFWFSGCFIGAVCYSFNSSVFSGLIRQAVFSTPSPAAAVMTSVLPVLLSSAAFFSGCFWVLYPVVFLCAFLRFLLGVAACLAFPSGGWLVCILFLYGSFARTFLLWFGLFSTVSQPGRAGAVRLFSYYLICVFIGLFDSLFVSPFLQNILL